MSPASRPPELGTWTGNDKRRRGDLPRTIEATVKGGRRECRNLERKGKHPNASLLCPIWSRRNQPFSTRSHRRAARRGSSAGVVVSRLQKMFEAGVIGLT